MSIPVNKICKASILSQSGGTCVCNNENDPTCAEDVEYALCVIGKLEYFKSACSERQN